MDETQPTSASDKGMPGAPELSGEIKPPSAPLVNDRQTGPIFKATPTPTETTVPVEATPSPVFDDVDDEVPEAPLAMDEHQARIEYLQSINQTKSKKRKRGFKSGRAALAVFLILIIVGAIGAAAYFWFHNARPNAPVKQPVKAAVQTPAQTKTDQQPATNPTGASTAEPKTYTSTTFKLNLTYPSDWTPDEQTGKLTITSPVVTLADASGQTTNGRMILSIRPRQDKPAEFAAGKVVAVLASDKVNYTAPAAGQRGSTYLSYLQYGGTSTKGGMDGLYITGNYGYKYAQTVQLSEISKIDPLVEVTFVSCADVTCAVATQKPLTVSSTAWKTDTTNRPVVEKLLKSIVFN